MPIQESGVLAGGSGFCPFMATGRSDLGSSGGRLKGRRLGFFCFLFFAFFPKLGLPQKPCSLRFRDCERRLGVS